MIEYKTQDHPEANGRTPVAGEQEWSLDFTLEDGEQLKIRMSEEEYKTFRSLILDQLIDEKNDPNYNRPVSEFKTK